MQVSPESLTNDNGYVFFAAADGAYRGSDVDALVRAIVAGESVFSFDLNNDTVVDENNLDDAVDTVFSRELVSVAD